MWTVYKHTCKINGKIYIGITKNSVKQRWGKDGHGYKPSKGEYTCFYRAIQKYGWDNFEHEILFEGLTYEQALEKEKDLIKFYNCKAPFGYNLTEGGDGTLGIKVTKEFRKKKSEAMSGGNNITARKVSCDGKIFDTINDCAEYLGVSRNKLVRWIIGKTIIPKDVLIKKPQFLDASPNYKVSRKLKTEKGTKVLFMGKIYSSITELSIELNIDKGTLGGWLCGRYGISKPYQWLLETDLSIYGQPSKIKPARNSKEGRFKSNGVDLSTPHDDD